MINVKINYFMLQTINAVFFLLSYLFLRDHFQTHEPRTLGGFLILLPLILAAAYAFFTNRIFYMLIKHREK
jgi:hypothetical protein